MTNDTRTPRLHLTITRCGTPYEATVRDDTGHAWAYAADGNRDTAAREAWRLAGLAFTHLANYCAEAVEHYTPGPRRVLLLGELDTLTRERDALRDELARRMAEGNPSERHTDAWYKWDRETYAVSAHLEHLGAEVLTRRMELDKLAEGGEA